MTRRSYHTCPTCGQDLRECPICYQGVRAVNDNPQGNIAKHDDTIGHKCLGSGERYEFTLPPTHRGGAA